MFSLPPVVRHVTHRSLNNLPNQLTSTLCPLKPKAALSNGIIPGQYHNLFVTRNNPPRAKEPDTSDTQLGSKCLVSKGGVNFRVTDIAPRTKGQMHDTPSLDFLVVHKGTVTLHLEGGSSVIAKEGDAIVQQGTVHAWENPTDEWVRMFVVLIATDDRTAGQSGAAGSISSEPCAREHLTG